MSRTLLDTAKVKGNFEFLEDSINTCINLKKVKVIIINQPNNQVFSARPQQHVMCVAQFGTFKSTVIKSLLGLLGENIVTMDDATKPALLGTITRQGEFLAGKLLQSGGKILAIDEWDALHYDAKQALLSPLENMRISRNLGFRVKKDIEFKDEFTDIRVSGGEIEGLIKFSCISMSMGLSNKTKIREALLSRFRLVRVICNQKDMNDIVNGKRNFNFVDKKQKVDKVTVTPDTWVDFTGSVYEELYRRDIFPPDRQLGYINRSIHDGLRDSIGKLIIENPRKEYIIDDSWILKESIENVLEQIKMYSLDIPNKEKYFNLIQKYPDKGTTFFAEKLGVTERTIQRYKEEYELGTLLTSNKWEGGNDE